MTIKKRILDLLRKNGPMLSLDMAVVLKMDKGAASQAAKELHDHGFIHIYEWRLNNKNGGNKVYKLGQGIDARKPDPTWKPREKPESHKKGPFKLHMDIAASWLKNPI